MNELDPSAANDKRSPLGIPLAVHHYINVGSLVMLMVGLPTSTFLTSLPQFIIAGNWLLEGRLKEKMKRFFGNPVALLLCSFYVMHLLGLLYTSTAGMDYGLEDVRKKIPLFLLPFLFSTMGIISDKEKRFIFLVFMLSVTFSTFYGIYLLVTRQFTDIREISTFVDPVRVGMMLVLSFFILMHYIFSHKRSVLSIVLFIWAAWMVVYLFIMQSLTAVILLFVIAVILLFIYSIRQIGKKNYRPAMALSAMALFIISGCVAYASYFKHHYFPAADKVSFYTLDKKTLSGNTYLNDTDRYPTENGHYVSIYICFPELKSAWNRRSRIPFESTDMKGNPIKFTLLRYLASKNLRKDSAGLSRLSSGDIKAIEDGIPNYHFNSLTSMPYRFYQIVWELRDYRHGGYASGHSLTQRFEFWKAALHIIREHLLAGVGTGNVRIAFADMYNRLHSRLDEKSRLRSHNQYLEIGVAFGIIGIVWFLFTLLFPAFGTGKIYTYHYFIFWLILMIAMLTEDTLETQAGATFYAFFNALLLFL